MLLIIIQELKIYGLFHKMVLNDASICLIVLFVNHLPSSPHQKKKKSLDRLSKISFVDTLGSCNYLSTTIQSERMTFHLLSKKRALWRDGAVIWVKGFSPPC